MQIRRAQRQTSRTPRIASTGSATIGRRTHELCRWNESRKGRAEGFAMDTEARRVSVPRNSKTQRLR